MEKKKRRWGYRNNIWEKNKNSSELIVNTKSYAHKTQGTTVKNEKKPENSARNPCEHNYIICDKRRHTIQWSQDGLSKKYSSSD